MNTDNYLHKKTSGISLILKDMLPARAIFSYIIAIPATWKISHFTYHSLIHCPNKDFYSQIIPKGLEILFPRPRHESWGLKKFSNQQENAALHAESLSTLEFITLTIYLL